MNLAKSNAVVKVIRDNDIITMTGAQFNEFAKTLIAQTMDSIKLKNKEEACQLLGISLYNLNKLIKKGHLHPIEDLISMQEILRIQESGVLNRIKYL
ncbi:hypothetical protein [Basilea psittacipulmonis]|uniref:Uncharacterized protein n=1 Tax=Basilea psittacipulmonis DSM 24701 TaxID=1072685 RepID=A0A077DHV1_9BURK|nr:hypothetical protein [Basilea psittacipulmonis]AIL33117.1 hypothetical protein IX83_07215 [Basilea psittacipulmonis DSM 24701]